MENSKIINIPEIIGKGYGAFWRSHHRYLVCKGSRGSKKSTTAALKIIHNIMRYPKTNALVVRRYDVTHRESTFAQLRWAINRLGVAHQWRVNFSPMQLTFMPTGQRILFRGMNDPQSIASIVIEDGYLTFVWIEEAYQIEKETDFDKLDLSIRGSIPDGLYKQFILTFNPWEQSHWLKKRFFDNPDEDTLAMTTNYMCNEFLGQDDLKVFERLKKYPRRYQVEGLGDWGITEGLIYNNWRVSAFDWKSMAMQTLNGEEVYKTCFGMDFGFSTDPTAFIACLVDQKAFKIYIFDDMYKYHLTNRGIVDELRRKEFHKAIIKADSEDARTINELKLMGLNRITGARKGPGSIRAGIQKLQDYEIIVHPNCEYTQMELSNYCWAKDKTGRTLSVPSPDGYDHLMDALRYATEDINIRSFSW
jgi:phage terminase large subunit